MKTMRIPVTILLLAFCGSAFAQGGPAQTGHPGRRVLIGFQEDTGPRTPGARAEVVRNAGGQVHASFGLIPVVSARLPEPAIANLQRRPGIAYVEDDVKMSIVQSSSQTIPWGIDRIDADQAWSSSTGSGVDVAILDTGIDHDHPDLQANIQGGIYFAGWIWDELFGKDGSTNPADWNDGHGHGTHCAGIVAAVNNTIGVVGVAPQARLWAVKVLSDSGGGYTSDIIQGIEWCASHGIEVASMSFGGGGTASLQNACQAAFNAGVFLVAAAGNDYGGPVIDPAAYTWVTAVSAVGQNAGGIYLADFSNVGPEIALAAPGVAILSTMNNGAYASWSGTSMACPHVAGAAALAWASGLGSPMEVQTRLWSTAEDLGPGGWDASFGYGLVDAQAAADGAAPADDPPSVAITDPGDGAEVSGTITVRADASDDNGISQVEFFVDGVSIGVDTVGSGGWSASWDTTAYDDGPHAVSATATDTAGQTGNNSVNVTVDNRQSLPVAQVLVTVKPLSVRRWWVGEAEIWVTVGDDPLVGATVEGYWSGLYSKTVSETTDQFGFVGLLTKWLRTSGSVTFTVTRVEKDGIQYVLDPPEPSDWADGP